jgi:cytochrome-b5 reductase
LGANPYASGLSRLPARSSGSTFKKAILSPSSFDEFDVVKLEPISPDTKVLTVKARLPTPFMVGTHVVIRVDHDGEHVERPYTPLSARFGKLELLVKKYDGGIVSTHCHNLKCGDRLVLRYVRSLLCIP